MFNKKVKIIFSSAIVLGAIIYGITNAIIKKIEENEKRAQLEHIKRMKKDLRNKLSNSFIESKDFPCEAVIDDKKVVLKYSIDEKLSKYIKKLLKRYRSDFSSVTVIDNNSGQVLAAIGYERNGNKTNNLLPFTSTHPSASVFKIITSAELLEKDEIDIESKIAFSGKSTTLYKYQLKEPKRWKRYQSFERAFAFSNNVIFGKVAINNIKAQEIFEMANKFGFNTQLMNDVYLPTSVFNMPEDQYNLAELASGFNRKTLMSPIHGAVIASIVANDGVLKYPSIIDRIIEKDSGKEIELFSHGEKRVIQEQTSEELQELMESTVKRGTARGGFRRMTRRVKKLLEIGGKTGTITGGVPFGKRDWFVAYAKPKYKNLDSGISISVMNVNIKKWYVKSTYLANKIIEYYYRKVQPIQKTVAEVR